MFLYLPIESELVSLYIGQYRTFGLRICKVHDALDEEIMLLPDVSTDFSFVLRLADILTRKQFDPIRLLAVIEDSI